MFSAASKTGSQPSAAANYIEDVFSTYLYTGNSSTQTINNGIDLSGKGGLIWTKKRTGTYFQNHNLVDTVRGISAGLLRTNLTSAQTGVPDDITAFNSNGYSLGYISGSLNDSPGPYVSWTFRKQPKFFDIVTFTTNSSKPPNTGNIAHNLGSTPGCVMIKNTGASQDWFVYHTGLTQAGGLLATNRFLQLNSTVAAQGATNWINVSSTNISFPGSALDGDATYVAYLFAHNAGGFGTAGTDNVISCGNYTGNGSSTGPIITLGYEPQYVLIKKSSLAQDWFVADIMRGMPVGSGDNTLSPNLYDAELTGLNYIAPTATGFNITTSGSSFNESGETYIYMAIRRPMKVPTTGTSVFSPNLYTEIVTNPTVLTSGFATDLNFQARNAASPSGFYWADRLRGSTASANNLLTSASTAAEATFGIVPSLFDNNTGIVIKEGFNNISGVTDISYQFRRASGFFDEVCYTGTGSATTFNHNLNVAPEMMIVKRRNGATNWAVYHSALGNTKWVVLNTDNPASTASTIWNDTTPTASVFTVGSSATVNGSAATYVAYLFATCAGVSKVGSYTGNGTTQAISCGFTGGARFVLIRRTDDWDGGNPSGPWYVYDTARGMTTLTDPYLLLNSTAAEAATLGSVTTTAGGFTVNSTILAAINASGGTYIFLAIA